MDNIVNLYQNPEPIEVIVDMDEETLVDIIRIIKMSPQNVNLQFIFRLRSETQVVSIESNVINNKHSNFLKD